jgi:hypothetical protein
LATGLRNAIPVAEGVSSLRTCPSLSSKRSWRVTLGRGNLGTLSDEVGLSPLAKRNLASFGSAWQFGRADYQLWGSPASGELDRADRFYPGNRRNASSPYPDPARPSTHRSHASNAIQVLVRTTVGTPHDCAHGPPPNHRHIHPRASCAGADHPSPAEGSTAHATTR